MEPDPAKTANPVSHLLRAIRSEALATGSVTGRPALSPRVLDVIAEVPRDAFVDPEYGEHAWEDRPLPIGHRQTISQPFIVALMTDLLNLQPTDVVLEVGTGSGYQAAVLSRLVYLVHSIEVIEPLAHQAALRLMELGYDNVDVHQGDGHRGWRSEAPYDAIIVTAATPEVPPALLEQLKPGGRMVIPLGPTFGHQDLTLIRKTQQGRIKHEVILPVSFVPLTD
ncbi:MAG: protein-L-isoaspartate(D-aspartate) O-methyltransferase [Burkholderiales bacterium]|nr:protein-L-isoaspartate(D-aspartate) O-methyltransferase [Burkholderiales bacterium]